jgi:hypothetical protein
MTPPNDIADVEAVAARLLDAFKFIDACAGEGMCAVIEGPQTICADTLAGDLCAAFGIDLDDGWPERLATHILKGATVS